MIIKVEPIAVLTIYGKQSDEEDYVTRHLDSTAAFMTDWKRKEIESWTFLQPELANSFMRAQAAWKAMGGTLFISDCLRLIKTQIDLKVRKPTLAAKPGMSLHGLGMAIDYDTAKLGIIGGKRMTFDEFNEHLLSFGWNVHYRAFNSSNHAEAWHIQPSEFRGEKYSSNTFVVDQLMNEEGPKIKGIEYDIINLIAELRGEASYLWDEKIRRIQRMGGLADDGVIGRKTRGYLALLNIKYEKVASTFKGE